MRRMLSHLFLVLFLAVFSPARARADNLPSNQLPENLKGIGITEKLGEQIDLNLEFTNEQGQKVRLGDYFHSKKPVILSLAYYNCPNLCGIVLNAVLDGLKGLTWEPGKEFEVINVSIDPKETFQLALKKKENMVRALGKPGVGAGWHFLVGAENQIKTLATQIGFGYRWDDKEKQYLHGAGIFVLTPEGKVSRILFGIQYRPSDLKLSLLEAANGKIGTIIDRIVLFCYSYNPQMRQYSVVLTRVMQVAVIVTTVLILGFLSVFWWGQRKKSAT